MSSVFEGVPLLPPYLDPLNVVLGRGRVGVVCVANRPRSVVIRTL
jgi:hypothetical protein